MEYKCVKIYDPEALVVTNGLRIAEIMSRGYFEESSPTYGDIDVLSNLKELTISDCLACSCCETTFIDLTEQRNHYKLDWHRYNLKRSLYGHQPVTEEDFLLLAGDVSSISSSDSDLTLYESDDCSSPETAALANTNHKSKILRHHKVFFENDNNQILSVYKCLLRSKKEEVFSESLVNNALNLVTLPKKWMIVMLGGGHFAAAIYDNETITHHKTFHCYTVRAKQGGSQSARDKKGGTHPKSAGASLRRYNEQALVQHVQDIISGWSEPIEQCNLILYRASGPWNRSTLFGGKKAPFCKNDKRLRNISIPTRRATLKEVKRVHDVLSTIEIYGFAEEFKNKFPKSPDRKLDATKKTEDENNKASSKADNENNKAKKKFEVQGNRKKKKISMKILKYQKEIDEIGEVERNLEKVDSAPERFSDDHDDVNDDGSIDLVWNESVVDFHGLQEMEDTVPESLKESMSQSRRPPKKKNKSRGKKKSTFRKKTEKEEVFERIRRDLVESCRKRDEELLKSTLEMFKDLPDSASLEKDRSSEVFTKQDYINCLNSEVDDETGNTILHMSALEHLPEFVFRLLMAGADPALRNYGKQTPYLIAGDKKTRDSFRRFGTAYPDRYDLQKANIPLPLTEEEEKKREEKRKEKNKVKSQKDKIRKQEKKVKQRENEERERFLALSDREKCALAAERRFLTAATANMKSGKPPVLSRCFQCGLDITGKVPFEYGNNRFCSMPCLKAHRAKTNSYGHEI